MINKSEKKYCLYFHINSFTEEVFYVGIGNKKRPNEKIQRSTIWHRTIKKYGYKVKIMHTGLLWQEACDLEMEYIKKFGRRDRGAGNLINQTDGGDGAVGQIGPWKGKKRPDLSERNKGNKYGAGRDGKALMTDEIKAKISKAHMGKVAHNKGKPGKKWSEEQRQKRIKLFTGRKLSEETKRKISIAHKGKPKEYSTWNKGMKGVIKLTEEHKMKIAESNKLTWHRKAQEASLLLLRGTVITVG